MASPTVKLNYVDAPPLPPTTPLPTPPSPTPTTQAPQDHAYFRPTDVERLCADPARANEALGWKPETNFDELVTLMVEHDLDEVGLDLPSARLMAADRHPSAARDV